MLVTIRSNDARPLSWTSGDHRIAENVRNLLRIWQGEAAFARPMGVDTKMPGRPALTQRRKLASDIRENIAEYEPDAVIRDVRVLLNERGEAVIEVDIDDE